MREQIIFWIIVTLAGVGFASLSYLFWQTLGAIINAYDKLIRVDDRSKSNSELINLNKYICYNSGKRIENSIRDIITRLEILEIKKGKK